MQIAIANRWRWRKTRWLTRRADEGACGGLMMLADNAMIGNGNAADVDGGLGVAEEFDCFERCCC